jgi:simple sugar transport system substrate-binding protein
MLRAMGITAAAGLLASCGDDDDDAVAGGGSGTTTGGTGGGGGGGGGAHGNFPETPEWNFVFVNHVTTNPFFVPTQYGAEDASALLGTSFQWTGSEVSEISEMVDAFEAAIAGNADGIAVSLVDLEAFNDPIDRAREAGIPVVSYNADAPNSRMSYIGQDLYGSGFAMGQRIVELVGEGQVALFIATPGQLNIQPRIDGAIAAIEESGAAIEYEDVATGAEAEESLSRIEAYYLGNTGVAGMFAVDALSTQGTGQVVQQQDARSAGLKAAGGYDLLPTTVELVSSGVLDFTIDQQPYLQGFLPVVYLYLSKLSGGVVLPPETNTGLVFLDSDSAKLFLDTSSRFEGDDEAQKIVEAG